MKIKEILEAKFSNPTTSYHGTTSKFLKSILKTGMNPNPKDKQWDTDPRARSDRHSLVSLSGSYWTKSLEVMIGSSANTRKKFGGNPLYVIASIQLGSAKADEDKIVPAFEREYKYALRQYTNTESTRYIADLFANYRESYEKAKSAFIQDFHDYVTDNKNKPVPTDLLGRAFDLNTIRKMAYDYNSDMINLIPNIPDVPDKQTAEQNFTEIKEKLTTYYRESVKQDTFDQSFRVTDPITYSGNNKITHILELVHHDVGSTFKLWYGDRKTIPSEFLNKFDQPNIIDVNKKVAIIGGEEFEI
jgi:hypothetical protein